MTRKILVVAAHPDDEVLGCGGLMARTLREGGEAVVLILTEGCSTQYRGEPHRIDDKKRHARSAMELVGGAAVEFVGLPDMVLSTLPPAQVNDPVTAAVVRHRPQWVLVHHSGDLNRDHGVVHEAARVACRPGPGSPSRLLTYETVSSTEWGVQPFEPNLYVSLQHEDLERKVRAFCAYESEVREAPHPRSPETIRHLAHLRGSQAGLHLAEAFRIVWERI
ncbi:MAG: PIG-L deacetylase family protein [Planctomycetota bacterium]